MFFGVHAPDQRLQALFCSEIAEQAGALETMSLQLLQGLDRLDGVTHLLHGLKGDCQVMGHADLVAHLDRLEDELQGVRAGHRELHAVAPRLLEVVERLRAVAGVARPHGDFASTTSDAWRAGLVVWLLRVAAHAAERVEHPAELLVTCGLGDYSVEPAHRRLLVEVLPHLIRNAVVHGIEPASVRQQRSKPPLGRIELVLRHTESTLIASISDDGGGFDDAALLASAARIGRVAFANAAALDGPARHRLALELGVSTRASSLSGRGIGLHIAATATEAAGGAIDIATGASTGTTVTISLPASTSPRRDVAFSD